MTAASTYERVDHEACPHCEAQIDEGDLIRYYECGSCGAGFASDDGNTCPDCSRFAARDGEACPECEEQLDASDLQPVAGWAAADGSVHETVAEAAEWDAGAPGRAEAAATGEAARRDRYRARRQAEEAAGIRARRIVTEAIGRGLTLTDRPTETIRWAGERADMEPEFGHADWWVRTLAMLNLEDFCAIGRLKPSEASYGDAVAVLGADTPVTDVRWGWDTAVEYPSTAWGVTMGNLAELLVRAGWADA